MMIRVWPVDVGTTEWQSRVEESKKLKSFEWTGFASKYFHKLSGFLI